MNKRKLDGGNWFQLCEAEQKNGRSKFIIEIYSNTAENIYFDLKFKDENVARAIFLLLREFTKDLKVRSKR